jgi:hypothetical protein
MATAIATRRRSNFDHFTPPTSSFPVWHLTDCTQNSARRDFIDRLLFYFIDIHSYFIAPKTGLRFLSHDYWSKSVPFDVFIESNSVDGLCGSRHRSYVFSSSTISLVMYVGWLFIVYERSDFCAHENALIAVQSYRHITEIKSEVYDWIFIIVNGEIRGNKEKRRAFVHCRPFQTGK